MTWNYGRAILEAILLASPEPLPVKRISDVMGLDERDVRHLIDDLRKDYQQPGRGLYLTEMAGGLVLTTRPEFADYVEKLLQPRHKGLSHAGLETLAIIAYRQPITKAEIEAVRGVSVDSALETLLEKRMIREVGRKESPGRPILYGTTREFMQYFGLKDLSDLPQLEVDTSDAALILRQREQEQESRGA
jgi:segregation and condensation protein B